MKRNNGTYCGVVNVDGISSTAFTLPVWPNSRKQQIALSAMNVLYRRHILIWFCVHRVYIIYYHHNVFTVTCCENSTEPIYILFSACCNNLSEIFEYFDFSRRYLILGGYALIFDKSIRIVYKYWPLQNVCFYYENKTYSFLRWWVRSKWTIGNRISRIRCRSSRFQRTSIDAKRFIDRKGKGLRGLTPSLTQIRRTVSSCREGKNK